EGLVGSEMCKRDRRKRTQFNEKLYKHQMIKGMIGDAVTQLHAARALCLKAGEMREANHPCLLSHLRAHETL
ncbi:acyl-CoA dehydrogenase family protein, partial [Bacillus pumilus]